MDHFIKNDSWVLVVQGIFHPGFVVETTQWFCNELICTIRH